MNYDVLIDGKLYRVDLERSSDDEQKWIARIGERTVEVDAAIRGSDVLSLIIAGRSHEVERERGSTPNGESAGETFNIVIRGQRYAAEIRDPRALRSRRVLGAQSAGPRKLVSPMPGKVIRVMAGEGAIVEAGAGVLVIEAMKMQNEIKSPKRGRIQRLLCSEGAAVNAGDVLAIVE
jgi:biotin carboxyl carrier protein